MTSTPVLATVHSLIREEFMVDGVETDQDLLAAGVLDSLMLVQLLVSIERLFGVTVPLEKLDLDDIRSVESISRLIERNQSLANGNAAR